MSAVDLLAISKELIGLGTTLAKARMRGAWRSLNISTTRELHSGDL